MISICEGSVIVGPSTIQYIQTLHAPVRGAHLSPRILEQMQPLTRVFVLMGEALTGQKLPCLYLVPADHFTMSKVTFS